MEAPPLERKPVAIVAADVEGYSSLMSIDEEGMLATLSANRAMTDALVVQHGGRICGTAGDTLRFLQSGDYILKKTSKRRAWTPTQVRELKSLARRKTPAKKIARTLKRSEGATRQKAFSMGLSLDCRM